jgi:rhodanese-related sulfurtransferase
MKYSAFIAAIMVLGVAIAAMAGPAAIGASYNPVAPKEFLELSKTDGAIILDVRDATDPKNVVMDGTIALPESDITKEKIEAIAPDKSKPLLLICNYSFMEKKAAFESRAMLPMSANEQAARKLMSLGYKKIYGLEYQPFGMGLSRLPLRDVKKEQK